VHWYRKDFIKVSICRQLPKDVEMKTLQKHKGKNKQKDHEASKDEPNI